MLRSERMIRAGYAEARRPHDPLARLPIIHDIKMIERRIEEEGYLYRRGRNAVNQYLGSQGYITRREAMENTPFQ